MTRLIDADALRDKLQAEIDKGIPPFGDVMGSIRCGIRLARNIVEDEPTIDAEPVKHGNWRFVNCATGLRCQCSECLHWVDAGTDKNYCPNCGADMRGTKDGSE